ncbi:MAG: hypothetical protein AAF846_09705 [Chloroflexota bacterium]
MRQLMTVMLVLFLSSAIMISAQDAETTETPDPNATLAPIELEPLLGVSTTPPVEITLPDTWQLALRDTYTYRDIVPDDDGTFETLPIDVYVGPLSNDTLGWIVMLWGYDTLIPFSPADGNITVEEYNERAAWLNGLRMLQFVVFDARCNIGTAPQRDYMIGNLTAIGTTFSAVDCPFEQPDTRGWFASLTVDGLNFSFFAYADPIQPAGSIVEFELQSILDTVVIDVESITISAPEFRATRDALPQLTPFPTEVLPTRSP